MKHPRGSMVVRERDGGEAPRLLFGSDPSVNPAKGGGRPSQAMHNDPNYIRRGWRDARWSN